MPTRTSYATLAGNARARIDQLRSQRAEQTATIQGVRSACSREERDPTDLEAADVRAAAARRDEIDEELDDLDGRATDYQRSAQQADHTAVRARQEGRGTYGNAARVGGVDPYQRAGDHSMFLDLSRSRGGDPDARERLDRHRMAALDELRARPDADSPLLAAMIRANENPSQRAASTGTGSGGAFVPPAWLVDEYIAALRPARATVEALHQHDMPPVGMTVNIPKLSTGTSVAVQATENTVVATADPVGTSVSANVNTLGGYAVLSRQLVDRSGAEGGFDQLILQDLLADYIRATGNYVLNGTGASNQPLGLLNVAGQSVAYTQATPAFMGAGGLYNKLAAAILGIDTARFFPATHIVMHPRRWLWIATATDTAGRAVVLPSSGNPANASAVIANGAAQGYVGDMLGCKVIADPNVPVNTGAGTNQDPVIVMRGDDSWWLEDGPYLDTYDQTLATQLSRTLVLYSYAALLHRVPAASVSVVNGTGLVTPTF